MIDFTLRQLRYALALAEEEHFGRAAERCSVSQPALSQQIRLMEDRCGATLFERHGRTIEPTPFGREFLARAERITRESDALNAFASGRSGIPSRPVQLGLIPTVAPYLLPDIYPALRREFPDIALQVSEGQTVHLLAQLRAGTIDLAVIATAPPAGSGLFAEPLFADHFVLATSAATAVAEPVRLDTIPAERFLLLDEGHCLRDQAIEACALAGRDGTRTFAATSLSTIVECVANDQGVTLLPAISLKKESADPRIRIHALAAPGAGRLLSLVWRETTPFSALFRRIASTMRREGARRLAMELPPGTAALADQPTASSVRTSAT